MNTVFEWDEHKQQSNLVKHGLDFRLANLVFDGHPAIHVPSRYPDEERYLTVSMVDDRFITVVWTWRGEVIRLISARRARNQEIQQYHVYVD